MTRGMIFKGTPGPWKIYRDGGEIVSIGPASSEEYAGTSWLDVPSEDANLIAAAPELLEALMAIIKDVDDTPGDPCGYAEDAPIIMTARAAIAKALGEQK